MMDMKRWASVSVGIAVLSAILLLALLSFAGLPHDPNKTNVRERFAPPGGDYLFGTDQFGRDIFSRIAVGARTTLSVGFVAVAIGFGAGVALGSAAALSRSWLDEIAMRFVDAVAAFPPVLLAILLATVMGPGVLSGMLAVGVATVPVFARLLRAELLTLREAEFVRAAEALGAGSFHIWRRHLWPNARAVLIVQGTVAFAHAILAEAALSYLGLGTQPPTASWGRMLREAQDYLFFSSYPALFPGVAIALTVFGLHLLGDGLRDALDPTLR